MEIKLGFVGPFLEEERGKASGRGWGGGVVQEQENQKDKTNCLQDLCSADWLTINGGWWLTDGGCRGEWTALDDQLTAVNG